MGVEVMQPKRTFLDMIKKKGWPSRRRRFCCSELKEYKILDKSIIGVRREESAKRKALYVEPELCRKFSNKEKVLQYMPILDWSLDDVCTFIRMFGIRCAPAYYDTQGNFIPWRRLGCMCCPLASRENRIREFHEHPNMVKLYLRGMDSWLENHPITKGKPIFEDSYSAFVRYLFFDKNCDFLSSTNNLFGRVDCKALLESYFSINLSRPIHYEK